MVAVAGDVASRFDMGRVVQRTFGVLGRNIGVFVAWAVVLSTLPQLLMTWGLQVLSSNVSLGGLTILIGIAGWVVTVTGAYLLLAAVVHATVADLNGKRVSFAQGLDTGKTHILPLIGVGILMTLAISLGLVLLIVPGLILATIWSVSASALVVERRGVIESMSRSRELTKGARWQVFALVLVYFALIYGAMFGLAAAGLVNLDSTTPATPLQMVVTALHTGVSSLINAIGGAAIYYELRSGKEGVGAEALASVFD